MVPKALTMGGWGFFGDLKSFQRAFDAGHDVQMHGTCAINKLSREEYEKDVVFTRDTLARIPGNIPDVYAYPCGEHDGHKREVVAKYCIGARGVGGGINIPGRTDYLKTKKGNINAGTLTAMLDEPDNLAYRGWLCEFTHLIGTSKDPETRQAAYGSVE